MRPELCSECGCKSPYCSIAAWPGEPYCETLVSALFSKVSIFIVQEHGFKKQLGHEAAATVFPRKQSWGVNTCSQSPPPPPLEFHSSQRTVSQWSGLRYCETPPDIVSTVQVAEILASVARLRSRRLEGQTSRAPHHSRAAGRGRFGGL